MAENFGGMSEEALEMAKKLMFGNKSPGPRNIDPQMREGMAFASFVKHIITFSSMLEAMEFVAPAVTEWAVYHAGEHANLTGIAVTVRDAVELLSWSVLQARLDQDCRALGVDGNLKAMLLARAIMEVERMMGRPQHLMNSVHRIMGADAGWREYIRELPGGKVDLDWKGFYGKAGD